MNLLTQSVFALGLFTGLAHASDWTNTGGSAARTGLSNAAGPSLPIAPWRSTLGALKGRPAFVSGSRVFHVRQTQLWAPLHAPLTCTDLTTGAALWSVDLPYVSGDNVTWCVGANNGGVYATRALTLRKFDAATGAELWATPAAFDLAPLVDAVFTDTGDLILGGQFNVSRINQLDGSVQWREPRIGVNPGASSCVIANGVVYMLENAYFFNLHIIKLDLTTGARLGGVILPQGMASQNPMFAGPDGTVYQPYAPTPGSPPLIRLGAFTNTATGLITKWIVESGNCQNSHFAVGADGSVYQFGPAKTIQRLDPSTGAVLNSVTIETNAVQPVINIVCDSVGHVYVSNGDGIDGRVLCFDASLNPVWSVSVPQLTQTAPALAENGTLVVTGSNPDLLALRSDLATAYCHGDGSGTTCPCGNPGVSGHGCANSVDSSGARLQARGLPVVSADTLSLQASGMPNGTALYIQGTARIGGGAGAIFGDGLRCVSGTVVRLATKPNAAGASSFPGAGDVPVSVRGMVPASGGVRNYQVWYRNSASFCTPASLNLSNGLEVVWAP